MVFLTELDTLGLPEELVGEIKRSDVKVLYKSRLLSVGGEGEVEKVHVHDLDEENEYDLFVDAVVLLETSWIGSQVYTAMQEASCHAVR